MFRIVSLYAGKSFVSDCLSYALGSSLILLSAADLLHKEVAAGEKHLMGLLHLGRTLSPSLLLIEDIDILCSSSSSSSSSGSRIIDALVTHLDEVSLAKAFAADESQRRTANALMIVATCRTAKGVDPRLLQVTNPFLPFLPSIPSFLQFLPSIH